MLYMRGFVLEKGDYSGKIEKIDFFEGITFSSTSYNRSISRGSTDHQHQNPHISLILTGQHLEKRRNSEYERKPGDILFCRAGESHHFLTGKAARNVNIELDSNFLKQNFISGKKIEGSLARIDSKLKILKMFYEFSQDDEARETSIRILLLDLFSSGTSYSIHKPEWITSLHCLLMDNWNKTLSLEDLSGILKIHPVTISKYFTKYFSCTFGEYRRKIKITKSLELVKNSSLSLTEIAYYAGFADQSHYIRNFKHYTGFTPKTFQKH